MRWTAETFSVFNITDSVHHYKHTQHSRGVFINKMDDWLEAEPAVDSTSNSLLISGEISCWFIVRSAVDWRLAGCPLRVNQALDSQGNGWLIEHWSSWGNFQVKQSPTWHRCSPVSSDNKLGFCCKVLKPLNMTQAKLLSADCWLWSQDGDISEWSVSDFLLEPLQPNWPSQETESFFNSTDRNRWHHEDWNSD